MTYTFNFPNILKKSSLSIKSLTDTTSYAVSSIHVTPEAETKFLQVSSENASKSAKNTFRSRNSFIIARNILSKQLSERKTNFKKVSKDVSTIWNSVAPSFKTYFEYLSILESIWYERKNSNLTGGSSISEPQEDYIDLCSSSYEIRKKTKKPLRGQTTKFRIEGAKPSRISKSKRKASNGFKISRSVINCNYGILTEDVFQE